MIEFQNVTGLVNFVCVVFELDDKIVKIVAYGKPNSTLQPSTG